jgi:CubicO group peptidase (beta-lactamase class C family)
MISPDELDRYFQQRTEQNSFSGVVLITQGSSQLFAGAYGYASRTWKVPNILTMRFDSASVTKLFTSVATLQLIDRGSLAFDTPVIDFLGLQDTAISSAVNVFHQNTACGCPRFQPWGGSRRSFRAGWVGTLPVSLSSEE